MIATGVLATSVLRACAFPPLSIQSDTSFTLSPASPLFFIEAANPYSTAATCWAWRRPGSSYLRWLSRFYLFSGSRRSIVNFPAPSELQVATNPIERRLSTSFSPSGINTVSAAAEAISSGSCKEPAWLLLDSRVIRPYHRGDIGGNLLGSIWQLGIKEHLFHRCNHI